MQQRNRQLNSKDQSIDANGVYVMTPAWTLLSLGCDYRRTGISVQTF